MLCLAEIELLLVANRAALLPLLGRLLAPEDGCAVEEPPDDELVDELQVVDIVACV